jgi:hypothetical protein
VEPSSTISIAAGPREPGDWSLATWFAILATIVAVAVDVVILWPVPRQLATLGYAQTPGTILTSGLISRADADGSTSTVSVTYSYAVAGRTLRGTRYSGDGDLMLSGPWAAETLARLRPGANVTVFYSAADPMQAVLRRGLDGGDVGFLLFWLPLNLGVGGAWLHARNARRNRENGLPVFERGSVLSVGVPTYRPETLALAVFGLAGFVALAIVYAGFGARPPLGALGVAWTVVLATSAIAFVRRRRFLATGGARLVIDTAVRTIEVPGAFGRPPTIVAWGDIARVAVRPARVPADNGQTQESHVDLAVVAETQDHRRGVQLATFGDASEAERFAAWLRDHTT